MTLSIVGPERNSARRGYQRPGTFAGSLPGFLVGDPLTKFLDFVFRVTNADIDLELAQYKKLGRFFEEIY